MEWKKMSASFIVMLFVLLFVTVAFAQEDNETMYDVDNESVSDEDKADDSGSSEEEIDEGTKDEESDEEDEDEIDDIVNPLGAQVRLLQLEKSITRNLLAGVEVLSVIEANHPDEDITELEDILAELEVVLDEVRAIDIDDLVSDEMVEEFVDLKKQAIELSQNFKKITSKILTEEDRQQIRDALSEIESEDLAELNEEIEEAKAQFNAEKLQDVLEKFGVEDSNLIEKVEAGEITIRQLMEEIRNQYRSLGQARREQVATQVRENVAQRVNNRKETLNEIRQNQVQRLQEKAQARRELAKEKIGNARERLANVRANIQQRVSQIKENAQSIRTKAKEMRENILQNAQERRDQFQQRRENASLTRPQLQQPQNRPPLQDASRRPGIQVSSENGGILQ